MQKVHQAKLQRSSPCLVVYLCDAEAYSKSSVHFIQTSHSSNIASKHYMNCYYSMDRASNLHSLDVESACMIDTIRLGIIR